MYIVSFSLHELFWKLSRVTVEDEAALSSIWVNFGVTFDVDVGVEDKVELAWYRYDQLMITAEIHETLI